MKDAVKNNVIYFLIGTLIGMVLTLGSGVVFMKIVKGQKSLDFKLPSLTGLPFFNSRQSAIKEFKFSFEDGEINPMKAEGGAEAEISMAHAVVGQKTLLIKIFSGHDFPGIMWEAYGKDVIDWSAKRYLRFDVYNNSEKYVRIEIKLKSGKNYPKKSFNYTVELDPLTNTLVTIPLDAVARTCDLSEMSYFKMFAKSPSFNTVLYLDNVRLE